MPSSRIPSKVPAPDPTLTMRGSRPARRSGKSSIVKRNGASTFVRRERSSAWPASPSNVPPCSRIAALLTRTSSAPQRFATASRTSAGAPGSSRSARATCTSPRGRSVSYAAARRLSFRATPKTLAPSFKKRFAVSRPTPRDMPVMRIRVPSRALVMPLWWFAADRTARESVRRRSPVPLVRDNGHVMQPQGSRRRYRVVLAAIMIGIGLLHFFVPGPFVSIVPAFLPAPYALVIVSGFFEVLGGAGLLVPPIFQNMPSLFLRCSSAWQFGHNISKLLTSLFSLLRSL